MRRARLLLPGIPLHITHRANQGQKIFHRHEDYLAYLDLLRRYTTKYEVRVFAYCLMPNHVHLIVLADSVAALASAVGLTHMRYAQYINARLNCTGHVWANRFFSTPLDPEHLWNAVRYVETNPVRAGLAARAEFYPYSSAAAHALGRPDDLLWPGRPFPGNIENWSAWLHSGIDEALLERIRRSTTAGRPLGSPEFGALFGVAPMDTK